MSAHCISLRCGKHQGITSANKTNVSTNYRTPRTRPSSFNRVSFLDRREQSENCIRCRKNSTPLDVSCFEDMSLRLLFRVFIVEVQHCDSFFFLPLLFLNYFNKPGVFFFSSPLENGSRELLVPKRGKYFLRILKFLYFSRNLKQSSSKNLSKKLEIL